MVYNCAASNNSDAISSPVVHEGRTRLGHWLGAIALGFIQCFDMYCLVKVMESGVKNGIIY